MKLYKYEHSPHLFPVFPLHPANDVKCLACGLNGRIHMAMDNKEVFVNDKIKNELRPILYCEICGTKYDVEGKDYV